MQKIVLLVAMLVASFNAHCREAVIVAAAADLTYCMEELNAEFAKIRPVVDVTTTIGSSGTFFAQIRNGAPIDVYLSADMNFPRRLIAEKAADANSLTPYAIGRIVVWTLRPDLDIKAGIGSLVNPAVSRIAIANPEHAPYGRAAKAAMERAGIWKEIESKVVMAENISQTRQFVQTGNAEIGIIALSLAMAPAMKGIGKYVLVPEDAHPRLEQGAVLTNQGAENPAARAYMEFLKSRAARVIFEKYGFVLPKDGLGY